MPELKKSWIPTAGSFPRDIDVAVDAWRQSLRDPTRIDAMQLARALDEKVMRPVRASTARSFTLFNAWAGPAERRHDDIDRARRAIARGQEIFNTKPIVITGVAGLNTRRSRAA